MSEPVVTAPDPGCDNCTNRARWAVQNFEGDDMLPTTRWFACGRHLHSILLTGRWDMDAVQLMAIPRDVHSWET